jgi:hypothetical protein
VCRRLRFRAARRGEIDRTERPEASQRYPWALATADKKLAAAAREFVETVSPADILRP